jgi:hypothetical protein
VPVVELAVLDCSLLHETTIAVMAKIAAILLMFVINFFMIFIKI